MSGATLISQNDQFTPNVVGSNNFVQGALVGETSGTRAITHVVNVTLSAVGGIKDVGLLRETVSNPIIATGGLDVGL